MEERYGMNERGYLKAGFMVSMLDVDTGCAECGMLTSKVT